MLQGSPMGRPPAPVSSGPGGIVHQLRQREGQHLGHQRYLVGKAGVEAGLAQADTVRELIPEPAESYRVIAPGPAGLRLDLCAAAGRQDDSFDGFDRSLDDFTRAKGLERHALHVFDHGAPVGFRLALAGPAATSPRPRSTSWRRGASSRRHTPARSAR